MCKHFLPFFFIDIGRRIGYCALHVERFFHGPKQEEGNKFLSPKVEYICIRQMIKI